MTLKYNKQDLTCQWFQDDEFDNEWTEKVPKHANQVFDENLNDWVTPENLECAD